MFSVKFEGLTYEALGKLHQQREEIAASRSFASGLVRGIIFTAALCLPFSVAMYYSGERNGRQQGKVETENAFGRDIIRPAAGLPGLPPLTGLKMAPPPTELPDAPPIDEVPVPPDTPPPPSNGKLFIPATPPPKVI